MPSLVVSARVSDAVRHGVPCASAGMRDAPKIVHIDGASSTTKVLMPALLRWSSWKNPDVYVKGTPSNTVSTPADLKVATAAADSRFAADASPESVLISIFVVE